MKKYTLVETHKARTGEETVIEQEFSTLSAALKGANLAISAWPYSISLRGRIVANKLALGRTNGLYWTIANKRTIGIRRNF